MMTNSKESSITKEDLRMLFIRSLPMEASFNYERMMSLAYGFCMFPIIKKLYSNRDDQKEALKRHQEFFNCTSATTPFILGVSCAMEEINAKDPNFDTNSINAMKAGLMGPLAGVGDAIFWGSLRIISAGIGISFAMKGNPIGPILFILLFNIPNYLVRYFGTVYGYRLGSRFIESLQASGLMDKLTYAINILGMTVIGAMTALWIGTTVSITVGTGDSAQPLQDILDSIMPSLLPLLLTFLLYYLMKKKNAKVSIMLFVLILIGIAGAAVGLF